MYALRPIVPRCRYRKCIGFEFIFNMFAILWYSKQAIYQNSSWLNRLRCTMKYAVVRQFPVKCFAHTQKSLWDLVITVHSISFLLAAVPIHIAVYVCVDRRVYICATTKYAMNSIKPGPIYAYRLDGLWFELSQCHHKMIEKKVLIKIIIIPTKSNLPMNMRASWAI